MTADGAAKDARAWEVMFEDRINPMTQTMPITQDAACNQKNPSRYLRRTRFEGTITGNELGFAIEGRTQMGNTLII
jgi:hypothetical protein